jgi:hypothetical protein
MQKYSPTQATNPRQSKAISDSLLLNIHQKPIEQAKKNDKYNQYK